MGSQIFGKLITEFTSPIPPALGHRTLLSLHAEGYIFHGLKSYYFLTNMTLQLWDVAQSKCIRVMEGHVARVGSLAWNSFILSR